METDRNAAIGVVRLDHARHGRPTLVQKRRESFEFLPAGLLVAGGFSDIHQQELVHRVIKPLSAQHKRDADQAREREFHSNALHGEAANSLEGGNDDYRPLPCRV